MATVGARDGRRADAVRNTKAIVGAAAEVLSCDPEASLASIAAHAGVGRVTLYGHFPSRAALVDAVLVDALQRGTAALDDVDLDGPVQLALEGVIESGWRQLDRSRSLLVAAQKELTAERIRELHASMEGRIESLLHRGQRDGELRADLPVSWLLATMHAVMHGAAEEITAGRLDPAAAQSLISATLMAAFTTHPPPHE